MFRRVFAESKKSKLLVAALLVLVLFAWAGATARPEEKTPAEPPAKGTTSGGGAPRWDGFRSGGPELPVERLVVTLAVLLVGAGALIWFLRRFGGGRFGAVRPGPTARMQLVGRLPLGGRRGLVMIRAAGRLLVLGVSEAGVQKVLDREDDGRAPEEFAGTLERMRVGEEER